MKVLCIDVGGTRIKASILKPNMKLNDLKEVKVLATRTIGWLNQSLPKIVDPNHWASFTCKENQKAFRDFEAIAIDGPWDIRGDSICGYYPDTYNIPEKLNDQLWKTSGIDNNTRKRVISHQNDAEAWLRGGLYYYKLKAESITFPIISLIFGTGVGVSYSKDGKQLDVLNPSLVKYPNLSRYINLEHNYQVHDYFSEKRSWSFFRSVREDNERRHWDYDRVRAEYSKRVVALTNDIVAEKRKELKKPKMVFIGGGFSEYVSERTVSEKLGIKTKVIRSFDLDINMDLIPLLGNLDLASQ
ncbi:MAG: hypothetical protein QM233_07715 [Candidatus Cloacimonadota bacterium]|jgi:hypothetical protein|nr:hypothetical protein [Candidatus Cloacimonadota bacterium]NMD12154.1 ROK family protein [Candidatus Cloacimonadota bacterium]